MTKETYLKSVDKLLDAYNSGNLFHARCDTCAVGNLLGTDVWEYDFCTSTTLQRRYPSKYASVELIEALGVDSIPDAEEREQIRQYLDQLYTSHGFTKEELMRIEYAFESSIADTEEGYMFYIRTENKKKGQFIGLTAVLKEMALLVEEEVPAQQSQQRLETIAREHYGITM